MNELENNFRYMDRPYSGRKTDNLPIYPRDKNEADYIRRMQIRQAFWQDRQRKRNDDRFKDKLTNRGLNLLMNGL
jgi:hypothetical protein